MFSTQLSMKFQLPIKTKMLKNKSFACLKHSDVVFILLIFVKIPSIVGLCPVVQLVASLTAFSHYEKGEFHVQLS